MKEWALWGGVLLLRTPNSDLCPLPGCSIPSPLHPRFSSPVVSHSVPTEDVWSSLGCFHCYLSSGLFPLPQRLKTLGFPWISLLCIEGASLAALRIPHWILLSVCQGPFALAFSDLAWFGSLKWMRRKMKQRLHVLGVPMHQLGWGGDSRICQRRRTPSLEVEQLQVVMEKRVPCLCCQMQGKGC